MTILTVALLILVLLGVLWLVFRPATGGNGASEAQLRAALADSESRLRAEQQAALAAQLTPVNAALDRLQAAQGENREAILRQQGETFAVRFEALALKLDEALKGARKEQGEQLQQVQTQLHDALRAGREDQAKNLETLGGRVEKRLETIQAASEKKLEEVRLTVDERLQTTLEKRLSESFQKVQESLDKVQRGLGEMQTLAQDVGGLKRVLSGVKTRGILGEQQLGALISDHLVPGQFAAQVAVTEGREAVDFAVKMPGVSGDEPLWLPIDAKFPTEDYERLRIAQEAADLPGIRAAEKALEARLTIEARRIQAKYLAPPATTDFAVMYLPSEGLYAEALRLPGVFQKLQLDHKVTIAGPTTLSALLNALQVGFRTLAISRRSAEVWQVLGEVKTEFGRFGQWIDSVNKKIEAAGKEIAQVATRTRAMDRKLRTVEQLPDQAAPAGVLPLAPADEDDETPV